MSADKGPQLSNRPMKFRQHYSRYRYLSSNVNVTVFNANVKVFNANNKQVPPVQDAQIKTMTVHRNHNMTAFGVLFNFAGSDMNTTVQRVEDMILEPWFINAITDEPDVFLWVGHMSVTRDRWPIIFNAIWDVHPMTPILIFGGHLHVRDCLQLDRCSTSLASGRYMETLGG
ncbi:hypothetical protein B0H14DRAFT_3644024 [Mycena olivaceomarginata]|nr:hypothetical protein B0H14DRAFT_3644024 [Mycena olivaceomarginata]